MKSLTCFFWPILRCRAASLTGFPDCRPQTWSNWPAKKRLRILYNYIYICIYIYMYIYHKRNGFKRKSCKTILDGHTPWESSLSAWKITRLEYQRIPLWAMRQLYATPYDLIQLFATLITYNTVHIYIYLFIYLFIYLYACVIYIKICALHCVYCLLSNATLKKTIERESQRRIIDKWNLGPYHIFGRYLLKWRSSPLHAFPVSKSMSPS